MGMQDRDWYRELTAAKNGLRYNKKNATYSAAVRASVVRKVAPIATRLHWSLQAVLCLCICAGVLGMLRLIQHLSA